MRSRTTKLGNPNRLCVCELANSGSAEFASKARALHTAERQTRIGGHHCIDENHSGFQIRREELLFLGIIRPRAGTETKRTVICHLDRLVCVAYPENGCDRTENLFAISGRLSWHIDQDRWLIEKSGAMNPISAGQQFCARCNRFLNLIVHALENAFRCERANFGGRVHGIANFQRAHPVNELIKKFIVDFICNEESLCGDARLSGVNGPGFDRRAERAFKIRAWHHNEGVAASKLEHALFDLTCSRACYCASSLFAAC